MTDLLEYVNWCTVTDNSEFYRNTVTEIKTCGN